MNPELLTIEVPENMIKAIQSKLDVILNQHNGGGPQRYTRTND